MVDEHANANRNRRFQQWKINEIVLRCVGGGWCRGDAGDVGGGGDPLGIDTQRLIAKIFLTMFLVLCAQRHGPTLADDELTTVRKNLETISVDVSSDLVSSLV